MSLSRVCMYVILTSGHRALPAWSVSEWSLVTFLLELEAADHLCFMWCHNFGLGFLVLFAVMSEK